jgi:DMSO/TMAO reductase YedYZ molybdopterin-dependent catalytic subunit
MPLDRRTFLRCAITAAAAPRALFAAAQPHLLQMNGYPQDAETPLELLTDYITPTNLFFIRSHWIPHTPDLKTWKLTVYGNVDRPLTLTLAELKRMPAAEATCVLQCAGNGRALHSPIVPGAQWRYGAVGNARWRGVRVKDVLDRAGLKADAKHLHLFGSDNPPGKVPPFHRSIEVDKALDDCILAWEMNGAPLVAAHGAPLRMVVPGWAGDHWMKWIVRISAQPEAQTGFYMETAYRYEGKPLTELPVKSNITTAPRTARVGKPETIHGFAFSGAPDVDRVEISDDDGATWSVATLDPRHAPHAWRRWSYRWTPRNAGKARLFARATDSRGAAQPREAVWNPSGYIYNAWHSVEVEVTS